MTNMYVFWKLVDDPPSPWTRLTRTNRYLRFDSNTANHWTDVGAATHTHSVTGYTCGYGTPSYNASSYSAIPFLGANHTHSVSSWNINSSNNAPLGYGLDIICIDMNTWETGWRKFPAGAMILSDGVLQDAGYLTLSNLGGKYIVHAEPGTTFGSSDSHSHAISATTTSNTLIGGWYLVGNDIATENSHGHTISLTSSSAAIEPRNLVTRLYEVTTMTSKALAGTVVAVDGTPSANWSILSGWAGGSLKIGDSNPTLSGSDTHTHSFSGNTSDTWFAAEIDLSTGSIPAVRTHHHPVSGTLASANHVPQSKYLVPAKLTTTLYAPTAGNRAQIIGLW